jgi:xylulokinase
LFNILETKWNEQALAAVGISPEQLPNVGPSGRAIAPLTATAASELGLAKDAWVIIGAHDQYAAALGAGVIEPGQVLLSCGTAWVLMVTTAAPVWGSGVGSMAVSRHAAPGRWGVLRSLGEVGTTVEWYVDTILSPVGGYPEGQRAGAFQVMNDELGAVPMGARGLLCFPMVRRGCLWGLTASHDKYDIGRAVLEGIAFDLRSSIEEIRTEQMPIRSVVMVGGAARSPRWPQIIADVLDLQVTVPAVQEAGARGAAIMAGIGLDLFSAETAFCQQRGGDRVYESRDEAVQAYNGVFRRYQAALHAFSGCIMSQT